MSLLRSPPRNAEVNSSVCPFLDFFLAWNFLRARFQMYRRCLALMFHRWTSRHWLQILPACCCIPCCFSVRKATGVLRLLENHLHLLGS